MDIFIGNICSMHLTVSVTVEHLNCILRSLKQIGGYRACLLPECHRLIVDLWSLFNHTASWSTHLDDIIR